MSRRWCLDWRWFLINPISLFPDAIDEMVFFQDNDIERMDTVNVYNDLILQGRYTDANKYIEEHSEVYGFFAPYLNAIENRISNLQEYLLTKQKKNPFVLSDEEPESVDEGTIWI